MSVSLWLTKSDLENVLLKHGGLPCILSFAVHLDLGHLLETQGYLGLLPEPCTPVNSTQDHFKFP